jgi:hypothetical protein
MVISLGGTLKQTFLTNKVVVVGSAASAAADLYYKYYNVICIFDLSKLMLIYLI